MKLGNTAGKKTKQRNPWGQGSLLWTGTRLCVCEHLCVHVCVYLCGYLKPGAGDFYGGRSKGSDCWYVSSRIAVRAQRKLGCGKLVRLTDLDHSLAQIPQLPPPPRAGEVRPRRISYLRRFSLRGGVGVAGPLVGAWPEGFLRDVIPSLNNEF